MTDGATIMESLLFQGGAMALLPLLLTGLYRPTTLIASIQQYLDHQATRDDIDASSKWFIDNVSTQFHAYVAHNASDDDHDDEHHHDMVPSVDDSKSIMLSQLLGSMYHEAVRIVANPQAIKVIHNLTVVTQYHDDYKLDRTTHQHVMEIEINQLLAQMGVIFNHGTITRLHHDYFTSDHYINKPGVNRHTTETSYFIDLPSWYCSCDGYQLGYSQSWIDDQPVHDQPHHVVHDDLKFIQFDALDPPPLCPHLLAALMIHFNPSMFPRFSSTEAFPSQL